MKLRRSRKTTAGDSRDSLLMIAVLAAALMAMVACSSACSGCRTASSPKGPAEAGNPTIRLYLVSDLAGALEPCGCTKDQLGGLDHFGAWIAGERSKAPVS